MARAASAVMTTRRLSRAALLRGTALQAAVGLALVAPAAAQPAPNARPMGGQVTAGSASIATTPAATNITQSTNRAAIDWTSYNIGSQQSVNYQQPSSTSITLNRVTSSDPSQIAGKINANGQIVITNQSGVTFYQGSEVNAQSVVVSAAGITNQNFMAGKMAFDQAANPNARIVNAGTITVKQAGLAALVAPSVANSGVINARLGQVVLAGAAAHTLDMYGDGLVSIDVTKQVTTVPIGTDGRAVTALVTNTGTIRADGGVVQLTASAADGVVQTLVRAGGHIQANTVGNQTGRIEVAGTGGSVVVEGRLAADGRAPGATGGQVMVAGSGTTTIAATAHISASGRAGGGTVAIGTTLARATGSGAAPAGTSARAVIASGARISANATAQGNGGRITVLSTHQTAVGGALAAKGGKSGGDGGYIEMSGEQGFSLTGTADTSAPHGALGTILLDPRDLTISSNSASTITPNPNPPNIAYGDGGTTTDAVVSPGQLTVLTGQLVLQASRNLTVASNLSYPQGSVTLQAGNNLTVNSGVTLSTGGNLLLYAGYSGIPGYNPAGTLSVQGSISGEGLDLRAGSGGITLGGTLTASTALELTTAGAVTQTAGTVQTPNIFGTASSLSLTQAGNQIAGLGLVAGVNGSNTSLTTTAGGLAVATSVALTVGVNSTGITGGVAVPTGQTIALQADTLSLLAGSGQTALAAPGGTVILQPLTAGRGITITGTPSMTGGVLALSPAELGLVTATALQLGGTGSTGNIVFGLEGETINLASSGTIGTVALSTTGTVTQGGPLLVSALSGSAGSVTLTTTGNSIPSVTGLTVNGDLTLSTANGLTLSGAASANGTLALTAGADLSVLSTGSVSAPNGGTLTAGGTLSIAGPLTSNRGLTLGAGTGGIALAADVGAGQVLTIQSTGPVTQTAGGITAGDLEGSGQSVSLPSRTNAIGTVAELNTFNVTGAAGDFLLVDSTPLTIASPSSPGGIFVQQGRTISLSTDSLTLQANLDSESPVLALSAPVGTIIISPFTSGYGMLLTSSTKPDGVLALTTTELGEMTAATLQLGTLDSTGKPTAGAITFGQTGETIDLGANGGFTTLNLVASGAVTQGGPLAVTTITGQAGSLALPYGTDVGSNYIQNLAGFTTTAGDISLHTSSGLTVSGTVSATNGTTAGNITLSSTNDLEQSDNGRPISMLLTGTLSGNAVVLDSTNGGQLSTSGGISQTGGTITATTLTATGLFATFPSANSIANVGSAIVNGTQVDTTTYDELTVNTTSALAVSGAVTSQTAAVTLNAAGITQSAPISAVEFDGTSSADTVLTNATNTIQSIGYFTQSVGDFTLATSSTLSFGGSASPVTATSGSLTFLADSVGLLPSPAGGISAAQGVVTFAPLTASRRIELIGATAADPNSLSLSQAFINRITAAEALGLGTNTTTSTTTGAINIANAGETVTVPVSAGLLLQTTGAVTEGVSPGEQNGGSTLGLVAANVTGVTGGISLQATANQIPVVGAASVNGLSGLSSTGSITITTSTALNLENAIAANATNGTLTATAGGTLSIVSGPVSGSAINLTAGSGTLSIVGALSTGGTLDSISLTATAGDVTQSFGALTTGSLSVAGNTVTLGVATNSIGTLAGASVTGGMTLTDRIPLTLGGTVSTGDALTVTDTGGGLAINGYATLGGLAVTLQGALTEGDGGLLQSSNLTGSASSVSLTGNNRIASIGDFTAPGGFTLSGNGTLDAGAPLIVRGTLAGGAISIQNYGAVTLSGTLTGSSVAITANSTQNAEAGVPYNSDGTITQTVGSVTAGTITLTNGDAFSQTGGSLTATGATGQITISTQGALTLGGAVSAPAVSLSAVTRSYSTDYGQETQVNPGIISQTGGSITGVVSGHSDTTTALTASGNAITGLAGFTSTGGFSLTTSQLLTVSGPVSDTTAITLNAAGGITLGASVTGGAVTLTAPGSAITQAAGALAASSLTGSAGSVVLGATGNAVTALDAFTTTGGFSLADSVALSIGGAVSVGTGQTLIITDNAPTFAAGGSLTAAGGTVALREYTTGQGVTLGGGNGLSGSAPITATTLSIGVPTGGPISIAGAFNLSTVSVLDLESGGAISETGAGAIGVGTLTGNGASAALGGANQITTLGGFTTTGAFALTDAVGLAVVGPLSATTAALNVTGDLALSGPITASTSLSLVASGAITQPSGAVTTPSLTGSATSATLGSTTNSIATLAGFTITDDFALTDGRSLTVSAPVDPNTITLTIAGDLALDSTVAATNVILNVTGAITEGTGGLIDAATLSGSAGSATLGNGNTVGTLGSLTTTTGLTLVDGQALSVSGPVTDGQSIALSSRGVLTVAGNITAPVVSLTSANGPSMAGGIAQTGGAIAGSTSVSLTSPGTISQSGGTIAAGSLTGSSTGTTTLGSTGNAVTTLAAFSSAGGFSLADSSALTVAGPVTDSTSVTLNTAGALALGGTVQTGALSLTATGAITQPGGSLIAASLAGSGAGITLNATGNSIGSLANLASTGDLSLTDSEAVTVTGAVSVATGHTLTLVDDSPTFGTGGSLSAPGGTVALREFTAGQGVTLGGGNGLSGSAPITATTLSIGAPTGGPVSIVGAFNLSTVSVLDLESRGAITESGTGAIAVPTLTGNGATAALGGANQIATLGAFTTSGAFALTDAQTLSVAGPLSATTAALNVTGDLGLSGPVTATTSLSLVASGAITQPAGAITTASLSGSGASAALGSTTNAVGTLAGFSTTGAFALTDAQGLAVSGLSASQISLGVTGALGINGTVSAGPVSLVATGAITEGTDGFLAATTLSGSAASASLGNNNAIGTLGSFATTTGLTLVDGQPLTVSGPVTDGQSIALSSKGVLTVAGSITAPVVSLTSANGPSMAGGIAQTAGTIAGSTSVSLTSAGTISQTGGTISAGSLNGSSTGTTTLGSTGNAVTTLAAFSSAGGFSLVDGSALTVTGPVTDSTSVTLNTAGTLALNGTVQTGALTLTATGAITQPGGSLIATSLAGSGAGIALNSTGNSVGSLANVASTADFSLTDSETVTVGGVVSVGTGHTLTLVDDTLAFSPGGLLSAPGGTVALQQFTAGKGVTLGGGTGGSAPITANTLAIGTPTGGPIDIDGALNLSTVSVLDLESGSAIIESGTGAITVPTLTGNGATAALGGANQIATLGAFTTSGAFALTDAQSLSVAGPLSATTAALNVTGDLAVPGTITAPTSLSLVVSGAITQPSGAITTASLSGGAATATFGSATNAVGTLAGFTTTGAFALTDAQGLAVSGLSASQISLAVTGALGIDGAVSAGPVSLAASGAITEGTGGAITATTLSGSAASASLGNGNAIGTLGSFATTTGLTLVDGQPLTVSGPVTDGQSVALRSTGVLTIGGNVTAPVITLASANAGGITQTAGTIAGSISVALTSAAAINETGGTIAAGSLTGSSVGTTTLGSTGNAVATLAGFSSVGGFSLVDGSALTITGPVTDSTSVTLNTAGALALNGTVQTGALSVTATGAISQPGGSLIVSSLTGAAGTPGAAFTQPANQVATLLGFTSAGAFALTDSTPLSIAGAVTTGSGQTLTISDNALSFAPGGSLTAPGGTVALREFATGQGVTLGGGNGLNGSAPITATNLTVGISTGGPITITGALNLSNVATLDLESGSTISETGAGAIQAAALTGSGTNVTLNGANQLGSLGNFTANSFALSVIGNLTLTGAIVAPVSVSLAATGAITQPSGSITTASLTGNAASATLNSTGNQIATLAGFSTTGDFSLFDGQSLTVTAPVDPNTVTLAVLGNLTLDSSVTGGTVVLNATGGIVETGAGQVVATTLSGSGNSASLTGSNQVTQLGNFQTNNGFALATTQPLAVTGNVTDGQSIALTTSGALTVSGGLNVPGTTAAPGVLNLAANGPVTLGGTVDAGAMSVTSTGNLVQTGGTVTLTVLGGSVLGQIALGTTGLANVANIGNLTASSGITLVDGGKLQIAGTLAAPYLALTATGQLTLADGSVIYTNGLPASQQIGAAPSLPGSYLQVLPGTSGTAMLQQNGTTTIAPFSGTSSAVRFDLPSTGGTLAFNALSAPNTDVVLNLGNGTASGSLTAQSLTVLGAGGSASFTGQVADRTGFDAAEVSRISPQVDQIYTLNNCAIGASSCSSQNSLVSTLTASAQAGAQASSVIRPDILSLDVLDLSVTRDRDDPTLLLPNISDRDY